MPQTAGPPGYPLLTGFMKSPACAANTALDCPPHFTLSGMVGERCSRTFVFMNNDKPSSWYL